MHFPELSEIFRLIFQANTTKTKLTFSNGLPFCLCASMPSNICQGFLYPSPQLIAPCLHA